MSLPQLQLSPASLPFPFSLEFCTLAPQAGRAMITMQVNSPIFWLLLPLVAITYLKEWKRGNLQLPSCC